MKYNTIPENPGPEWLSHLAHKFHYRNGGVYKTGEDINPIGSINEEGYITAVLRNSKLTPKYKNFKLHHIVWYLNYGEWPELEIDHIDQDRTNNYIDNLMLVTHQENMRKVNDPF